MNRALPCIRVAISLTAIAVVACGCAAGNNATSSQASAQGEQAYKTMYGVTSEGTTTDLYTEMFGSNKAPAPATNVAAAQPVQFVPTQSVTSQPIAPVQPQSATATSATRPGQVTATTTPGRSNQAQTSAAYRTPQPPAAQPAPVQVAQQPAPPPPEPDVPTAYGITANGPTTDLYTAIFGPRRSDSQ